MTPCNPSPSFPLHGWAALGGAGRGNGTCVDHDDIEEDWRNHVQNVTNDPSNDMLLSTFVAFGKLFNVSYYEKLFPSLLCSQASFTELSKNSTFHSDFIFC